MVAGFLRRYVTGILPRSIMGQILKAFVLALLTLTIIFVLFVVVAKVADAGLGPRQILFLVPYSVPSTLPYTAPVALLFAVSVVYGRVASDNEVLAVKASGQGAMVVLAPSLLLGIGLSGALLLLSGEVIPRMTHEARLALIRNTEDMLYRYLKKQREFDNPGWPFHIKVGDVRDRTLVDAYFRHRTSKKDAVSPFDLTVYAEEASLHFDQEREVVRVKLVDAAILGNPDKPDIAFISNDTLEIPLPGDRGFAIDPPVQELTSAQLAERKATRLRQIEQERRRQAIVASMYMAAGLFYRIQWPEIHKAVIDHDYWRRDLLKLETETHTRIAVACGAFFFVMLGAPVGIRKARGDFLSAFMVCFLPIILLYYPLVIGGINLGKEGLVPPVVALWLGNLLLGGLSGFSLQPVLRH